MGLSFIFSSVLLLVSSFLSPMIPIPIALSAIDDDNTGNHYVDQLYSSISNSFEPNSNYPLNMISVVNDLVENTSLNNGFMSSSKLSPTYNESENAYGHALCRHDISPEDCSKCLTNVSKTIVATNCSFQDAAIWYDHCLLMYSNDVLFPFDDYTFDSSESDAWKVTFTHRTLGLLYKLVGEVTSQTNTMFANGNLTYGNETAYAMVQCTRDLSVEDCTVCLAHAITKRMSVLQKKCGKIYSGSCIVRYEMFPFLE